MILSAAGYADTKPTAGNDMEEGRASNRRIEIVLYPKALTVLVEQTSRYGKARTEEDSEGPKSSSPVVGNAHGASASRHLYPTKMSGQEPEDQRLTKELSHIAHFETAHQIKPMHLSRAHANLQMVRDFPIRQSFGNETQNFQLSRGEQMCPPRSPLPI